MNVFLINYRLRSSCLHPCLEIILYFKILMKNPYVLKRLHVTSLCPSPLVFTVKVIIHPYVYPSLIFTVKVGHVDRVKI